MHISLLSLIYYSYKAGQCAIPAFQDLLPEPHNKKILHLLFTFAHWHGMAKLRLHTDVTLDILDNLTTQLSKELRDFQKTTCANFQTFELRREAEARKCRQNAAESTSGTSTLAGGPRNTNQRQTKKFNLQTYKIHALGD